MMVFFNDLFYFQLFEIYVKFLYYKVCDIIRKLLQDWSDVFIIMNVFFFSNVYIFFVQQLFQKDEFSKEENKLRIKIVLWFMDKEYEK